MPKSSSALQNSGGLMVWGIPTELDSILYIPRHDDGSLHTPIYAVSKVLETSFKPSSAHEAGVHLKYLQSPRLDGTDAQVEFFVNQFPAEGVARVERRGMGVDLPTAILPSPVPKDRFTINFLSTSALQAHVHESYSSGTVADKLQAARLELEFVVSYNPREARQKVLQWRMQNDGLKPLHHILVDADSNEPGDAVQAMYFHKSIGGHQPSPTHNEGFLLTRSGASADEKLLILTSLFSMLSRMRQSQRRPSQGLTKRLYGQASSIVSKLRV
ncbi:hypothetical protein B0I35DRAFT_169924 [Stachybotrys elegans]|uniref:Uncharacterized protein n=1 Tax=Stachybotrys elegans TaxID=80388 RepID=A0A8K0SXK8_9HYPO|nr:hypothetical protein B0I35DRAFT_169924 [Stachybotrys elegans]